MSTAFNATRNIVPAVVMTLAVGVTAAATSPITDEAYYQQTGDVPTAALRPVVHFDRPVGTQDGTETAYEPFALDARLFDAPRATFTVGPGASCDFPDLNAALSSGNLGDGDVINVAHGGGYIGQTYTVLNRPGSLTIRGGFDNCDEPVPGNGRTALDADGAGRVFYIETGQGYAGAPMEINLEGLSLRGGNTEGSFGGGGLMVNGRPGLLSVNLRNVWVEDNFAAASAGGIKVRVNGAREGGGTLLTVDNASAILGNVTNGDGGGLGCESLAGSDTSTLIRLGHVPMLQNEAENGGAVSLDGCGGVFFYAGHFLLGVVGNEAVDAGGAFYVIGDGAYLSVRADSFSGFGENTNGAQVLSNSAARGGALYARDESRVFFFDTHLNNNSAAGNGGAIYANAGAAEVHVRRVSVTEPCNEPAALQASRCSMVSGNSAGANGGAFLARNDAAIYVSRTLVENNNAATSGAVASVSGAGPGTVVLESVLATGNGGGAPEGLVAVHGNIELRWSTMTDNAFTHYGVRAVGASATQPARIDVLSSILWEDSGAVSFVGASDSTVRADCVIGWQSSDEVDLTLTFGYRHVDPEFIDPADGDFRPGPTSPALDFCDGENSPEVADLDGNARGTPHQGPPISPGGANFGPYDLGAYEMDHQPDLGDEIFRDRFED